MRKPEFRTPGQEEPIEPTGPTPRRRPRRLRRIIFISLAVVVVIALAGTGYAFYSYQHFVNNVTHINAIVKSAQPKKDLDGTDQNILLVGDDHRPADATAAQLAEMGTGLDGGGLNTDTMLVMHIPADGSKVSLISFPRDSWVSIPGFGMNKLNAAFQFGMSNGGGDAGGAQLLIKVIQNMTGLTIDHFVRISMLGFYNVAKTLGPVTVCLNNAVDDPYSTINLPKGVSTLNAQQALAFVRQRHGLPGGDLDREVRQQYFLTIEARRLLSAGTLLDPGKLQSILTSVSAALETDPGLDFLSLANQLRGLTGNNLVSATIPILGTPTISVGRAKISIVQVNQPAMAAFIAGVIGVPSTYLTVKAAPVSTVTVAVVNGRGTNGLAAAATTALNRIGFQTIAATSAPPQATTTIGYPAGQESAAKALSAYVPGAVEMQTGSGTTITLTLGTDGHNVTAAANAGSGSAAAPVAPAVPATKPTPVAKTYAEGSCIN